MKNKKKHHYVLMCLFVLLLVGVLTVNSNKVEASTGEWEEWLTFIPTYPSGNGENPYVITFNTILTEDINANSHTVTVKGNYVGKMDVKHFWSHYTSYPISSASYDLDFTRYNYKFTIDAPEYHTVCFDDVEYGTVCVPREPYCAFFIKNNTNGPNTIISSNQGFALWLNPWYGYVDYPKYITTHIKIHRQSKNNNPTLIITSPTTNSFYGNIPKNKMTISGTVKDSDNGDTLKTYYRINGSTGQPGTQFGTNITANGTNQNYNAEITLPVLTDGNHTLYVWVEDDKGGKSTETAIAFKIDKTNPTTPTVTVNENWSKDNVTATITGGTDSGSGVDKTEYSLSGATTLGWTNYTGPIAISSEGTTIIKARTIDKVGNISSETSKTVKIDKTNPIITFNTNGNNNNQQSHSTTVNVTDNLSGIKSLQYVWSSSTTTPSSGWITFTNGAIITKSDGVGAYYLHIKAIDNANNIVEIASEPFIFNTPPTLSNLVITPTIASDKPNHNTITVKGKVTDIDSDALDVYYKVGATGVEIKALSNIDKDDFSFAIVIDSTFNDGVYDIYVWADDKK